MQLHGQSFSLMNTPQFSRRSTLDRAGLGYITSAIQSETCANGIGGCRAIEFEVELAF